MDKIGREKELLAILQTKARASELGKIITELCELRLARYKDTLVKGEDATVRGRAQELRDILKEIQDDRG